MFPQILTLNTPNYEQGGLGARSFEESRGMQGCLRVKVVEVVVLMRYPLTHNTTYLSRTILVERAYSTM